MAANFFFVLILKDWVKTLYKLFDVQIRGCFIVIVPFIYVSMQILVARLKGTDFQFCDVSCMIHSNWD